VTNNCYSLRAALELAASVDGASTIKFEPGLGGAAFGRGGMLSSPQGITPYITVDGGLARTRVAGDLDTEISGILAFQAIDFHDAYMYSTQTNLDFKDCSFKSIGSAVRQAAISADPTNRFVPVDVLMTRVTFDGYSSTAQGGAIYAGLARLFLTGALGCPIPNVLQRASQEQGQA
jgi:predicted outer membrane repeat protein